MQWYLFSFPTIYCTKFKDNSKFRFFSQPIIDYINIVCTYYYWNKRFIFVSTFLWSLLLPRSTSPLWESVHCWWRPDAKVSSRTYGFCLESLLSIEECNFLVSKLLYRWGTLQILAESLIGGIPNLSGKEAREPS